LILSRAREITRSDAGSIYLVEEPEGEPRRLRFEISQNDSATIPLTGPGDTRPDGASAPISDESIAGHVALTGAIVPLADAHLRPLLPRRGSHGGPRRGRPPRRPRAPPRRALLVRPDPRAPLCLAPSRLRQGWRSRGRARQGQEAAPRGPRADSPALRDPEARARAEVLAQETRRAPAREPRRLPGPRRRV